MLFGQCDACDEYRVLHHCIAYGIETAACAECRGGKLEDDIDEYVELAEKFYKERDNAS